MEMKISTRIIHCVVSYVFLVSQCVPLVHAASLSNSSFASHNFNLSSSAPTKEIAETILASIDDGEGQASGYIADSFQVTERGTAQYSFPISLPEGVGGMKPQLSVNYDSSAGNGVLGMGWSLGGISSITRCGATLAQDGKKDGVDFDENDRYCLDGQRLVVVNGAPYGGPAEYRTENDTFSRITMDPNIASNGGHNGFEARTKDGLRYVYGYSSDSRIEAQGRSEAIVWRVSKIVDSQADDSGNGIYFDYTENNINGEHYIEQIRYGGNVHAGLPEQYTVKFLYENRPDPFEYFVPGSKVSTTKRLKEIQLFHQGVHQKSYNFTFEQSGATGRTRLANVQYCSSNGDCLLPTQFEWTDVPNKLQNTQLGGYGGAERWSSADWLPSHRLHEIQDFDNDGIAEVITFQPDGLYFWDTISAGNLQPHKWANGDWTANAKTHGSGDLTGDGIVDIVTFQSDGLYIWKSTGTGLLAPVIWSNLDWRTNIRGNYVVDLTGDGRADVLALQTNGVFLYESSGSGFLAPVQWAGGNWHTNAKSFEVIDITGDGRLDIVSFEYSGLYVWDKPENGLAVPKIWSNIIWSPENRPHGLGNFSGGNIIDVTVPQHDGFHVFRSNGLFFHAVNPWSSLNWAPNARPHGVADLNADGFDDLFSYQSDGLYVWLSTGLGFRDHVKWSSENWSSSLRHAETADFTGDGKPDFISFQQDGLWVWPTEQGVSDLLVGITNGHGKETKITYTPLTNQEVYSKGPNDMAYPAVQVQSSAYVVTNTQMSNGLGGLNGVNYSYLGLYYALDGRGFCGFRSITSVDSQTKLETIRVYEQAHPYKSLLKSTSVFSPEGVLISYDSSTWETKSVDNGTNYFVYEGSKYAEERTLAGDFIRATSVANQVDQYGNPTQILKADNLGNTTTTTNTYTNDTSGSRWYLGRLNHSSVLKYAVGQPAITRESSFEYEQNSGRLRKEIIEPNHPTLRLEKSYERDALGNIRFSTVTGPTTAPRTTETRYDPSGRFIVDTINPLGHSEHQEYFNASGQLRSVKDVNSHVTSYEYDSFDRIKLETSPTGTTKRTLHYLVTSGAPAHAIHYTRTDRTGQAPEIKYFDVLDREVRKEFVGLAGQKIFQDTEYNTKGEIYRESAPYFENQAPQWTVYEYDVLGRVTQVTQPGNRISRTIYSGLTVTTRNPLGQEFTKVSNVLGQDNIVRDHLGNEIHYTYDSYGNVIQTIDAYGNQIKAQFDVQGNRIGIDDPDTGITIFEYNELGELVSSTNAENQIVSYDYDAIGRPISRIEPEGETVWEYDTVPHGIGLIAKETSPGYRKTYSYDSKSRLQAESVVVDRISAKFQYQYDSLSRLITLIYPSGYAVKYTYNINGYMTRIRQAADNKLIWELNEHDADGQIVRQAFGNGLSTRREYDPETRYLTHIRTGIGNTSQIQNLRFNFDTLGNLKLRADDNRGLEESFTYDELNRLTSTSIAGVSTEIQYDDLGNIISKSDVGSYFYGEGAAGPHAVTSIVGEASNTYSYDAKGNRIAAANENILYTSYNKPYSITKNGVNIAFLYGPDRSRIKQIRRAGAKSLTRYYFGNTYEHEVSGKTTKHKHFIHSPDGLVAIHANQTGTRVGRLQYIHKDHLGSTQSITSESAKLVEILSYDAWGVRRNAIDWSSSQEILTSTIDQGFTGHEHLDDVGLIHMKGRVYDPAIGRFLSADPHIQSGDNLQNLNRYSYVLNNPLSFTDPSGYFFKKLFKALFSPIGSLLRNSVIKTVISVALLASGNPYGGALWLSGFQAVETLANGGNLIDVVKGAALNLATASVFNGIGRGLDGANVEFLSVRHIQKVVAHGVAGGVQNVASGGKFQHGFLSAAVAQGFAPAIDNVLPGASNMEARILAASVVGGTASKLGGGSFANGAITGGFARLYNDEGVGHGLFDKLYDSVIEGIVDSVGYENFWSQMKYGAFLDMIEASLSITSRYSCGSSRGAHCLSARIAHSSSKALIYYNENRGDEEGTFRAFFSSGDSLLKSAGAAGADQIWKLRYGRKGPFGAANKANGYGEDLRKIDRFFSIEE